MSLLDLIFGCTHQHTTWPQTVKRDRKWPPAKRTYIACLECGKEFPYSWREMRVIGEVQKAPIQQRPRAQVVEIGEFRRIARSK